MKPRIGKLEWWAIVNNLALSFGMAYALRFVSQNYRLTGGA